MNKWEYKKYSSSQDMSEHDINQLGEQGWECVSMTTCLAFKASPFERVQFFYYIFKRFITATT